MSDFQAPWGIEKMLSQRTLPACYKAKVQRPARFPAFWWNVSVVPMVSSGCFRRMIELLISIFFLSLIGRVFCRLSLYISWQNDEAFSSKGALKDLRSREKHLVTDHLVGSSSSNRMSCQSGTKHLRVPCKSGNVRWPGKGFLCFYRPVYLSGIASKDFGISGGLTSGALRKSLLRPQKS